MAEKRSWLAGKKYSIFMTIFAGFCALDVSKVTNTGDYILTKLGVRKPSDGSDGYVNYARFVAAQTKLASTQAAYNAAEKDSQKGLRLLDAAFAYKSAREEYDRAYKDFALELKRRCDTAKVPSPEIPKLTE